MHSALAQRGTKLHNTYACKMTFNTPLKNTFKKLLPTTATTEKAYDVEKRIPERKERNTKEMKGWREEARNKKEGQKRRVKGGKKEEKKRKEKKKKERKKEGRKKRKKEGTKRKTKQRPTGERG